LAGLLVAISFLAALGTAHATDATWDTNPGSNDWNTNTNWTPQTVPTGTASFGSSNTTSITLINAAVLVGTIQFNAGAPTYSFNIDGTIVLTGTGIINNSSNAPTFSAASGGLEFDNTSTAGNAVLITTGQGHMDFLNTSTAGNAMITNDNGGSTRFQDTSTAGNATITNNNNGFTRFLNTSIAGNATITTNNGGVTRFNDGSTGGNARFITNASGIFDISGLTSGGMTAGSIEGAGTYDLGSKSLTVGGNNLSTEVSGIVADGGNGGGTGGSLVKVGSGTLTLCGANTYTGSTTIAAGTLEAAHATAGVIDALGPGGVTLNGGTLRSSVTGTLGNDITFGSGFTSTLTAATGQTLTLNGFVSILANGAHARFGSATDN
jgi:autotransporter-associated beta strand protein